LVAKSFAATKSQRREASDRSQRATGYRVGPGRQNAGIFVRRSKNGIARAFLRFHLPRMPWTNTFDTERGAITFVVTGVMTPEDFEDGIRALYSDKRFDPDFRVFLDLTGVTGWRIPTSAVMDMAINRRFSNKSRTALLVSNAATYGMGRVFQTFAKKGRVQLFTHRVSAMAWLNEGLPPEKALF
jgi:hypothetical protein